MNSIANYIYMMETRKHMRYTVTDILIYIYINVIMCEYIYIELFIYMLEYGLIMTLVSSTLQP